MSIKKLFLAVFVLALSITGYSQGIHAGLKGGVNMYKIDGSTFKDEFNYGYNAGGFVEISFTEKFGIQPEILWNQQQLRTSEQFDDIYNDGIGELKDVKLNYLSIPLLLSYSPSKVFTFQAGPQVGILLNKDETLFNNGRQAFKSGDFSLLGGVQLNFGGFKLGGRYFVGLNNINDVDNREEWKNQGFQLYAGFRLF